MKNLGGGKTSSMRESNPRDAIDGVGQRLYCSAHGCPMRATVYFGSALCTWHDISPKTSWPQVTAELQETLRMGKAPQYPQTRSARWVERARAK